MKYILLLIIWSIASVNSCRQNENKYTSNSTSSNKSDITTNKRDSVNSFNNVVKHIEQDKENENNYFSLISATSESWIAGIESAGSGTKYYFKILVNVNNLTFDSAWINNKVFNIFITKETSVFSNKPITYSKGDTIYLRVSDIKIPNQKPTASLNPPIQYSGDALIRFIIQNKQYYYTIKKIQNVKSINRH